MGGELFLSKSVFGYAVLRFGTGGVPVSRTLAQHLEETLGQRRGAKTPRCRENWKLFASPRPGALRLTGRNGWRIWRRACIHAWNHVPRWTEATVILRCVERQDLDELYTIESDPSSWQHGHLKFISTHSGYEKRSRTERTLPDRTLPDAWVSDSCR